MKNRIVILGMLFCSLTLFSQDHLVTLSGGYAFANIEYVENNSTGWRLMGLYEFNPNEGKLAHGLSFGYIGTSSTGDTTLFNGSVESVEAKVNSYPVYYAPKLMFGGEKLKVFVKGAIGLQFSNLKYTGPTGVVIRFNQAGFYGGLGGGLIFNISEKVFINAEYEWAYMGNSYYRNGFINSAMIGVGVKF